LAGGQEVRGRYRLAVQRIEADGRLNLVPLQVDSGMVRDSEILRVELGADLAARRRPFLAAWDWRANMR